MAATNGIAADGVKSAGQGTTGGGLGGGGLEVERIRAFRDVHALVPDKKMVGRKDLDLEFVEAEPTPIVASTTPAPTDGAAQAPAPEAAQASEPAQAQGRVAAQDTAQKPPAEPTMTGVADHIWATVARKSGAGLDPTSSRRRTRTAAKPTGTNDKLGAADTAGTAGGQSSAAGDSDTDIREAWLRGNVALHQDSPPDKPENPDGTKAKPKSQDINGEAVYLDNHKGKGKMLAWVFYRDPNQPPRPGPLPWAKVANDDMTIRSEKLRLDQEHDKVWGDGPGVLTQWTDRALLTDNAEEPSADSGGGTGAVEPARDAATSGSSTVRGNRVRTSSDIAKGTDPATGTAPAAKRKPRTRGGRPVSDKELLTITWAKRMEFTGRTTDPMGRHAGRADFFGSPNAKAEDAQLKCVDRMIVFTDREVPLGELGTLSKGSAKAERPADEDGKAKDQSRVNLALIYCYGKTVAVSRKIDPDLPIVLEKQLILAEREPPLQPPQRRFPGVWPRTSLQVGPERRLEEVEGGRGPGRSQGRATRSRRWATTSTWRPSERPRTGRQAHLGPRSGRRSRFGGRRSNGRPQRATVPRALRPPATRPGAPAGYAPALPQDSAAGPDADLLRNRDAGQVLDRPGERPVSGAIRPLLRRHPVPNAPR